MEKTTSHDIVSPYTGKPSVKKGRMNPIVYIVSAAALIVVILLIVLSVVAFSKGEDGSYLIDIRDNTPTLQLFAKLDREIPMAEIDSVVHSIEPSAEVIKEDDGTGSIRIPDNKDYILFDYYLDEEGELEGADEEFVRLVDIASGIRYVYPTTDDAYNLITYSDDKQTYLVFIQGSEFEFATKDEAVNNYLSPEVKQ